MQFSRAIALTTCSAISRLGSISTPFINLLSDVSPTLSLIVYGLFLLLGAIASFFIWPETNDKKMAESIEECVEMTSSKNKWLRCC